MAEIEPEAARLRTERAAEHLFGNFPPFLIDDGAARLRGPKRRAGSSPGTGGTAGIDLVARHRHHMGNAPVERKLRHAVAVSA